MLVDFIEGIHFHQFQILLQQPGWYHPHALCWRCIFCNNESLISSVIGYIFNTSCDEVWKKTSPGDGRSSHSSVGITIMRLHDASLTLTNVFFSSIRGLAPIFFLIRFSERLCILFYFCLYRSLIVPCIVSFFSTIISGDEVKVYSGFLFIVFF